MRNLAAKLVTKAVEKTILWIVWIVDKIDPMVTGIFCFCILVKIAMAEKREGDNC